MNGSTDLAIELPAEDARTLRTLAENAGRALGALSGSHRLRMILDSPEGRDLVDVADANRDAVARQEAEAGRGPEVRLRLWVPAGAAYGALTAARAVLRLIAGGVAGVEGLGQDEVLLAGRMLGHAAEVVAAAGLPGNDVRFPARSPAEMLEMVEFWRQMDGRMRELRETTALPRAAVTLPDEFDDIVAELWQLTYEQATRALEHGDELVEIRIPRSPKLRALAAWASERMDLLEGLVRAGMVQKEWERPLKTLVEMFQATIAELGL